LVWNRLTYVRDPDAGRRRSRARQAQELVVTELPELRIVPDALWLAARARQTKLDAAQTISAEQPTTAFWSKQRPRYLFSGLMRCGICGAGYSKANAERFGCSGARNKGPTNCTNNRTIRREVLESTVIDGLRQRLMDPDTYKAFVLEFTAEWNRTQTEISGDIAARETELERTRRQIERLVDALADGTMPASAVSSRLSALETRRLKLESELIDAASPAPLLHPNLAEIYRARMATLATAIESDDAAEARDVVRHLVDSITLTPDGDALHIDIRGELANILSLTNGRGAQRPEILAEQIKMVAGAGYHLCRTKIVLPGRAKAA
jgi:site-specific DNA recombinase